MSPLPALGQENAPLPAGRKAPLSRHPTQAESNPFPYSADNKRYYTWNHYLRQTFGGKVCKVSLDGGFTCPNIDGTKGVGGCSYCSGRGSGDFAGDPALSLPQQLAQGAARLSGKWPDARYIAYFQAHTNTYAPLSSLRQRLESVLGCPGVVGLSVATRGDCLPEEVADYLAQLSQRTWLMVELGLQTVHEDTARRINRCHSYPEFLEGYRRLTQRGIPICIHIIDGLPGESREQMLDTVRAVAALEPHSVKIHLLHLLRGTPLGEAYLRAPFPLPGREEYVRLVCDQLELLPPRTVIQRLTGDGPRNSLIAPLWSLKKGEILNEIDKELFRRNSWQGKYFAVGGNFCL